MEAETLRDKENLSYPGDLISALPWSLTYNKNKQSAKYLIRIKMLNLTSILSVFDLFLDDLSGN